MVISALDSLAMPARIWLMPVETERGFVLTKIKFAILSASNLRIDSGVFYLKRRAFWFRSPMTKPYERCGFKPLAEDTHLSYIVRNHARPNGHQPNHASRNSHFLLVRFPGQVIRESIERHAL
jgi:hypothetical protein